MRKTKIICTLGPATDKGDVLRKLMQSGVDVVRLNFSHQTHEEQKVRADKVKPCGKSWIFRLLCCWTPKALRSG